MASTIETDNYPKPRQIPVVHSLHGYEWEDPFDWLRQRKAEIEQKQDGTEVESDDGEEEEEEESKDDEDSESDDSDDEVTVDDPAILSYLRAECDYTARMFTEPQENLIETLYQEFKSRVRDDETSLPAPHDGYFWYSRYSAGEEYPKYCRAPIPSSSIASDSSAPPPHVLFLEVEQSLPGELVYLDVNELMRSGQHEFIDVAAVATSPDLKKLAYAVDTLGSERYTLYVKDVASGQLLGECIENVGDEIEWSEDSKGFYYLVLDEQFQPYRVMYHLVDGAASSPSSSSSPANEDLLVYEEHDKEFTIGVSKTRSRAYILIDSVCTDSSEVHYISSATAPPADGSGVKLVEARRPGVLYEIEHHPGPYLNDEARFFLLTNADDAQDFQLMECPVTTPSREHWRTVVQHVPGRRIAEVDVFRHHLVLSVRIDTLPALLTVALPLQPAPINGNDSAASPLLPPLVQLRPPVGSSADLVSWHSSINWDFEGHWLRVVCDSPVALPTALLVDLTDTSRFIVLKQETLPVPYDPAEYRALQIRVPAPSEGSADEVLVPATLLFKRSFGTADQSSVPFSGPLLMYGYGAYEVSSDPSFSITRLSLLDRGVGMVLCHVRGGGENGRAWYLAGRGMSKRNTFTDFIAIARYLVDQGYTRPEQLAALGGSAGGMLMGVIANMAPTLFRAIVADVPFVDCLNTMLSSDLPLVTLEYDEWGNPAADKQAFEYIRSYSPYDNLDLSPSGSLPTMLVTGGLHDKRVCYHEPAKYVAKYRALLAQQRPGSAPSYGQAFQILLKMDMATGHFSKTGRYSSLREEAVIFAFIQSQLCELK